ncbi:MAG: replication-associated recombination protein A [Candidatus Saccharimonadales bacterium]
MSRIPLAEKMRPTTLADVVGQTHIVSEAGLLRRIVETKQPVSLILWGPPGTGKTTLARILAHELEAEFVELSAVTAGKKDVMAVVEQAKKTWKTYHEWKRANGTDEVQGSDDARTDPYKRYGEGAQQSLTQQLAVGRGSVVSSADEQAAPPSGTILFVDEIHRFNKAQQDAFLPHVESGLITLIGATTENPSFEIISPLLSRSRVLVLEPLSKMEIISILKKAIRGEKATKRVSTAAINLIAELSGGDARLALGNLEVALSLADKVTPEVVKTAAQRKVPGYDKKGDMHYDVISAFIKSLRGSDVTASLYYLSRMIDAGEDPKFIARRMVIFASEDIGLAGNGALALAVATFQAVERIGLPEANYNLYHCAVALARSSKSREITDLMHDARAFANQYPDAPVPLHLRNAPTKLMRDLGYAKDTEWEAGFKHPQGFLPEEIVGGR